MKVDIIYTYYNNHHDENTKLLNMYLDHWSNNFNNTKHNINFVIIDDHSPKKAIDIVSNTDINCNLQLYHVKDDILWNEMGARNLGASQTTSDIILFLDWDTFIYEELILDVFKYFKQNTGNNMCGRFYQKRYENGEILEPSECGISRLSATGFCLLRDKWNEVGPFDEDFAGAYGGYDLFFLKYLKRLKWNTRCITDISVIQLRAGTVRKVYRDKINNKNGLVSKTKGITRDSVTRKLVINKEFDYYTPPTNSIRFKWSKQYENML